MSAKSFNVGKDYSVQLPGIIFTKCLNGADKNLTVENDSLTVRSEAKRDYFNATDGKTSSNNAPVLLAEVDNTLPFTFSAKVTPELHRTYDAGALYIYLSDTMWHKFAFERDERDVSRIVSVRTIDTSDDNNHEAVLQPSVHLKISSDATTIAFYFSMDNVRWNLARLHKNNYPEKIFVGVSSQSPWGDGNSTRFDHPVLMHESVKDFRAGI